LVVVVAAAATGLLYVVGGRSQGNQVVAATEVSVWRLLSCKGDFVTSCCGSQWTMGMERVFLEVKVIIVCGCNA
jgi:hypothetical protein